MSKINTDFVNMLKVSNLVFYFALRIQVQTSSPVLLPPSLLYHLNKHPRVRIRVRT